jgi:acetolactate synthase-1/3 small subunit
VFQGTEQALHQILSQTAKLEVVKKISPLDKRNSIYRELLLIKLRADKTERSAIMEIVQIYRGKIDDLSRSTMIVELTGNSDKIDGFMDIISCYDILEVCRTGITGISRGDESMMDQM